MPKVTCAHCGNPDLDRSAGDIAKNTTKLYFCNNACRFAYQKKHGNWNKGKKVPRGYHPQDKRASEALSGPE
jgi:hypothetical protein